MTRRRRRRRNPDGDNLGLIVGGMLVSGVVVAAILWWGSSRAAALPGVDPNKPETIALFPDLKFGDLVQVDTIAANIPGGGPSMPTLICVVDQVLSDPTIVSVHGQTSSFKGTITRDAILRVLPPRGPGDVT